MPGTATDLPWAISWGVIATYLFAITVFTSWPRKRLHPRVWRAVHLTSVLGVILAGFHSFQAGSDATSTGVEVGLVVCAALVVYSAAVRGLALLPRRER